MIGEGAKKFALLIDIDNVAIDEGTMQKIFNQIEVLGEVAYAKFYGYSDRKHKELDAIINANAYETAQRMRLKKRNKSQLDSRILIDAVKTACTNPSINAFCIVGGAGDFVPLIMTLKSMGKFVVGGFINDAENAQACHHDLDVAPVAVKIPKVEALKPVPKVSRPQQSGDATLEQELADLSKLDLNNVMNIKEQQEADAGVDLQSMFKEIERVVKDFKEINKD